MPSDPVDDPRVARWRTATIMSLVVGYAGFYLCRSDLSVCTKLITADAALQIDDVAIGKIASLGTLLYAAGKLVSGVLCDFLGGRVPFLAAMLITVLCTWWFGASAGFVMFLAAWCCNRLVQSTGWSALVKISSNWFSHQHYGRVMGILSLSWLFGDAIGRFFLGTLIRAGLGWRGVFGVAGCVLLAIWILGLFTVKETPEDVGGAPAHVNPDNLFGEAGQDPHARGLFKLLLPFLTSISFWAAMAMCFGLTLIRETVNLWLPQWFSLTTGVDSGSAAQYSSLYPLFGGFSVIVCGWVSDRFMGGRRGLVIALPLVGLIPVLFIMGRMPAGATGVPLALLLVALSGILMIGPYSFLGGAISLDLGGRQGSATAAGLMDGAGYAGGTLSGWGAGVLIRDYGWPVLCSVLAGAAVFSMLAAMFYWYRHEVVEHRGAPDET